jgi:hypothetical protein
MAAFLAIQGLPGDPDDLLARKRAHLDPLAERLAPACGWLLSVTVRTDDGLLTFDLWASREAAEALAGRPEMALAWRESGLPDPARFEGYEVAGYAPNGHPAPAAD